MRGLLFLGTREKQNQTDNGAERNQTERYQQHCVHKYSLKKIYNANKKPAIPQISAITVRQPRITTTVFFNLFTGLTVFFFAIPLYGRNVCFALSCFYFFIAKGDCHLCVSQSNLSIRYVKNRPQIFFIFFPNRLTLFFIFASF